MVDSVYVRKEEHINAHFLICFIALTMTRLLQRFLTKEKELDIDGWGYGITAAKLKAGLNMLSTTIQCDIHYAIHKPIGDVVRLLDALGITDIPNIAKLSDLVQLKNRFMKVDYMP